MKGIKENINWLKDKKGITLLALVVTIIILLIIAGITIGTMRGRSGIITQASEARNEMVQKEEEEKVTMATIRAMGKNAKGNQIIITEDNLNEALREHFPGATVTGDGKPYYQYTGETGTLYNIDSLTGDVIIGDVTITPGGDTPGGDTPGGDTPGGDTPGGDDVEDVLESEVTISGVNASYVYTGSEIRPSVSVSYKGGTVSTNNYTIEYLNNINAGEATIVITFKEKYRGVATKKFQITEIIIANVPTQKGTLVYTGETQTPEWNGYDSEKMDLGGTIEGINVGSYRVTFTPKKNYKWNDGTTESKNVDWVISAKSISGFTVTGDGVNTTHEYTGSPIEPRPTVKDGETTLVLDTDYTLSYTADHTMPGIKTITITGKGEYGGETSVTYTITKIDNPISVSNTTVKVESTTDLEELVTNNRGGEITYTILSGINEATNTSTINARTGEFRAGTLSRANDNDQKLTVRLSVAANEYCNAATKDIEITVQKYERTIEFDSVPDKIEYEKTATAKVKIKSGSGGTASNVSSATFLSSDDTIIEVDENVLTARAWTGSATITGTLPRTTTVAEATVSKNITVELNKSATANSITGLTYTGEPQTVVEGENVTWSPTTLTQTNAGSGSYTATPITGYAWSDGTVAGKTINWTIGAKSISGSDSDSGLSSGFTVTGDGVNTEHAYTGSPIEPKPTVKDGDTTLVENTHYTLSYTTDHTTPGDKTITISGIGNYNGETIVTYTITKIENPISVSNITVKTGITTDLSELITNNRGGDITYEIISTNNEASRTSTIDEETDEFKAGTLSSENDNDQVVIVRVSVDENTYYNATTKNIAITVQKYERTIEFDSVPDKIEYEKTAEAKIKIKSGSGGTANGVSTATFSTSNSSVIEVNENILTAKASTGSAIITGTLPRTTTVAEATVTKSITVELNKSATASSIDGLTYTGEAQTVVEGEHVIWSPTTLTQTDAGSGTYTATPEPGYAWSDGTTEGKTINWTINAKTIANVTVEGVNSTYRYTGSAIEPLPIVKDGTTTLTKDVDYTLSYTENHTDPGYKTVTITGSGTYSNATNKVVNYTINPIVTFYSNGGDGGSMDVQEMPYGVSTALNANAFTKYNHTFTGWTRVEGNNTPSYTDRYSLYAVTNIDLYACWEIYDIAPPVVSITRKTYNSFDWKITDDRNVTAYKITNTFEQPTSGWTSASGTSVTGTKSSITTAGTYYVWAKDSIDQVAVGSITAYTLTRSQGTNTTLTTRVDSTSSSTGTKLTTTKIVYLEGTPIWTSATATNSSTELPLSTLKENFIDGGTVASNISEGTVTAFNEKAMLTDTYGNTIIVPKGFGIASDSGQDITKGIVIEDVCAGTLVTRGSQFVWVPVGENLKYGSGIYSQTTIKLGRYDTINYNDPTQEASKTAYTTGVPVKTSYYEYSANTTYGNTKAKNLGKFISSTIDNGGFYIARYEAGINGTTEYNSNDKVGGNDKDSETHGYIVSKANTGAWTAIKQTNAAKVCQNMYMSNVQSDLINSYAWDTTLIYTLKLGSSGFVYYPSTPKTYGSVPVPTGTNILSVTNDLDKVVNIYDLAGNVREWTTETYANTSTPATMRGGSLIHTSLKADDRAYLSATTKSGIFEGFRPILYF